MALGLGVLLLAACGRLQPIQNMKNQYVPHGLTQQQVGKAIRSGAANIGWGSKQVRPGLIEASIVVRGTYHADVDISYTANSFNVTYKSSKNLNYDKTTGAIHRNYNRWIANLVKHIQSSLSRYGKV